VFSRFFIERPVFAAVLSIIILLAGAVSLKILPIAQYPEIAPPVVTVTANYPGASAQTLASTVAAPIEEQLSGVENLLYYSSTSASNGQAEIQVTFEVGTDVDKATFDVNNRVQLATPRLPDEGAAPGGHGPQGFEQLPARDGAELAEEHLRPDLHLELRDPERRRRGQARARRR
jgi:multidrug efflux pump subunit AcrB